MEKIASFFTTVALIFSYLFGFGTSTVSEGYELVRNEKLNAVTSMFTAQGLCYDGEYFYGSGALTGINFTGLAKFDENMKCIEKKANAVPWMTRKTPGPLPTGWECHFMYLILQTGFVKWSWINLYAAMNAG